MNIKKFWNKLTTSEKTKKEILDMIHSSMDDKDDIRIAYINIYGDIEACWYNEWSSKKRATKNISDIIFVYVYTNDVLSISVNVANGGISLGDLSSDREVIYVNRVDINEIINQLELSD